MKKELKTNTYGDLSLKLVLAKGTFFNKTVDLNGILDLETGEVTFKISDEDLIKARDTFEKDQ